MQRQRTHQIITLFILVLCLVLFALSLPIVAQDTGSGFATNTVAPADTSAGMSLVTNTPFGSTAGGFPTNTPPPAATMTPLPTSTPGPAASVFNYSLRIWLESDLVDLAFRQIGQVRDGVRDSNLALQVTLYELERRFPGAPRDTGQRVQLIDAMLQAPIGSIDMRSIVRPFIETALNEQPESNSLEVNGFRIATQAANLDNLGMMDAVVHIVYVRPEDEATLYDDYILALRNDDNSLSFLESTYDLTAAPFGGVQQIKLEQVGDVNHDAVDEVVLRVEDGQVNSRLYILASRNGVAIELTQPEEEIRFGEIINWDTDNPDTDNPTLNVLELQRESSVPNWSCISAVAVTWTYERNFYRPSIELNDSFVNVDSLGCTLFEAEPLFALPPAEAIATIESALLDYGFEADSADRALLTLSMLYVLQGRLADAQTTAQSVIPAGDDNSWTARQANALLAATGVSSNTALDICEAMAQASDDPACDMNSVLGRYLAALPLTTGTDLIEQLEVAGLPVFESVRRSEVGRADRVVVSFLLAETDWWGFYEQRDGTYLAEPAVAPEGFEVAIFPQGQIKVPQSAYDALFVANDPSAVLAILENLQTENPDIPFRPDGLYLRAIAYDLTANREESRLGYFEVWERYPDTIWAQLASEHLVQR
ncbi:MAG: hypothetical protein Q9P44_17045 [Anaerolineae bacterium]|nr:hypothetical protein [Anaerolineae bacterium]